MKEESGTWVEACVGRGAPKEPSPAELYLAKLSRGSRPAAASACRTIAAILGTTDPRRIDYRILNPGHVEALCATLREKGKPGYARRLQGTLAGLIRAAWRGCWIEAEHRDRLLDSIPPIKVSQPPTGTALSRFAVDGLLATATLREAAIIALGVGAGLRRHEMAALRCSDVSTLAFDVALIRIIRGKGGKYREVRVHGKLATILKRQRDNSRQLSAQLHSDPLYLGYTVDGISKACDRMAKRNHTPFSPHDLRRTFCTNALARGIPLHVVQQLMGHESPRTTVKYDRGQDEEIRKAAEKLAF
jgi:integrase